VPLRKETYGMPQSTDSATRRLEIKKYPNRRYYDATHSRHLTLEEIRSLIQEGYDIHAVDARSGADITAQLLTQIILELDTPKIDSLPVPLLVRLIRMNDGLIKDFIETYFNQALRSFLDYQRQFEEQIRRTHKLSSAFPSVAAWTKAFIEPFSAPSPAAPAAAEPAPPDAEPELREQLRKLQEQVAALTRQARHPRTRTTRHGPARRRQSGPRR
jgi:polyhydroxyalkanoate synthesis repressor PhaR